MFDKGKAKEKKERPTKEEMMVTLGQYMAAQDELKALKEEYGIEEEPKKEGRISHAISSFFERQESREKVAVKKKVYIFLAVLTGWMGGHRFYAKHYRVALFYLLFFWMGIGLYHSIIDVMQVIPMQPDENGRVLL